MAAGPEDSMEQLAILSNKRKVKLLQQHCLALDELELRYSRAEDQVELYIDLLARAQMACAVASRVDSKSSSDAEELQGVLSQVHAILMSGPPHPTHPPSTSHTDMIDPVRAIGGGRDRGASHNSLTAAPKLFLNRDSHAAGRTAGCGQSAVHSQPSRGRGGGGAGAGGGRGAGRMTFSPTKTTTLDRNGHHSEGRKKASPALAPPTTMLL